MNPPPVKQSARRAETATGKSSQDCRNASATRPGLQLDVFAEARARYTIPELWSMLRLPGEPPGAGRKFSSPFRPDRNPSCDISRDGRWFADRSEGLNLDAVAFVRHALDCDWQEVRAWFMERLGIDRLDAPRPPQPAPERREIEWPAELIEGRPETWEAFGELRRVPYSAVWAAVKWGFLRFCRIDGRKCYVITDQARRAAEIRRIDGQPFGRAKAYPLRGVDKSWPIGSDLLQGSPLDVPVLITEGATDFLAALGCYTRWIRENGGKSWVPLGFLGASCRSIAPELQPFLRNRLVRLVPDGDEAGDKMADYWRGYLAGRGCTVERLRMPEGRDLRDLIEGGELQPGGLFG